MKRDSRTWFLLFSSLGFSACKGESTIAAASAVVSCVDCPFEWCVFDRLVGLGKAWCWMHIPSDVRVAAASTSVSSSESVSTDPMAWRNLCVVGVFIASGSAAKASRTNKTNHALNSSSLRGSSNYALISSRIPENTPSNFVVSAKSPEALTDYLNKYLDFCLDALPSLPSVTRAASVVNTITTGLLAWRTISKTSSLTSRN
jgi:hypothetical protein